MPVWKALSTLAVPTIISQLITMVYNLADTFFIGRTNDPLKVAAASLTYCLVFLMCALANLFGIGGGSLVSRLLGAKEQADAGYVSAFSFWGSVLIALIYSVVCWLFMEPLLKLLGASSNTMIFSKSYTFWVVVVGGIPCVLSMSMAHLLRCEGYSKQAGIGLGMGGCLNIVLDPLFMFVIMRPGNEVTGAAVATMLSNLISLVYFFIVFRKLSGEAVLSIHPKDAIRGIKYTGEVLKIGFPSALGTALACASNMTINKLASGYGDIPVAAFGIVKKIDMLPMNTGMGLCQGMLPLVAYNYASGNYKRMKDFTTAARTAGMGFAVICIIVFEVFARQIVGVFIREPETLAMGTDFLRICCLSTPLMIFCFQMNYTFQAMGKGPQSLILSSCRQGLINIPLLFLMRYLFGLYGLVWTQLITDVISVMLALILYRSATRELFMNKSK